MSQRSPLFESIESSLDFPTLPEENNEVEVVVSPAIFQTYKRRWYIVGLFAVITFLNGLIWNTFGPIEESVSEVFDWGPATIALLPIWIGIMYLVTFPACMYITNEKGLRMSMILTTALMTMGTIVRCFYFSDLLFTIMAHLCACLNGFASTLVLGAPTVLSSSWFSESERTTATAIASVFNYIGVSMSFLIGPALVKTFSNYSNDEFNSTSELEQVRSSIMTLMYIECCLTCATFLLTIAYFPSHPPTPPSRSAATGRVSLVRGAKLVIKKTNFLLLLIPVGLVGMYSGFGGVMVEALQPLGINQKSAGWIGFISVLSGCLASLVVAQLADHIKGRMKTFLIITVFGAFLSFLWLAFITFKILPANTGSVYASNILGGLFTNSGIPLYYELSCETCYPVPEVVVSAIVYIAPNLCTLLFLVIALIPGIGTEYMAALLSGFALFGIPSLLAYKEHYNRLNIDQNTNLIPAINPGDTAEIEVTQSS